MTNTFELKINNLKETDKVAVSIAKSIKDCGGVFCLYGDVGAGKTTLVKAIAKHLNIKERVTSPSFVILNEYHSGDISLYHFDLYRLEDVGVESILDELREYTENNDAVAFIEWAEFSDNQLPDDRIELRIKYIDEDKRIFSFEAFGKKYDDIIDNIKQNLGQ